MANRVVAACDGACKNNPGPAGWGWVIADPDERVVRWASGPLGRATNNIAELTALRELLGAVDPAADLEIRMDSTYAMQAVTKWLPGWKARGWMTASKKPVANREIIEAIDALLVGRTVRFVHVAAHQVDGDVLNALADRAASAAATTQQADGGTSADDVPEAPDEVAPRRAAVPRQAARSGGITAKYPGTCGCGQRFAAGEKVVKHANGKWGHPACAESAATR
ncbi:ribonuclease H family protein [Actinomadura rayongensis]|uniref:Ribonuclease H n=1 Tax=Actinomadura rayongensis TaxID=1429076 RepID=A0A6I4W9Q9_9ACTN|nr:ribonuclease H [Actinomadura rayongensis]MXQ65005.1 reverse transcriptase-like protein [Actinomadura rayongensis]